MLHSRFLLLMQPLQAVKAFNVCSSERFICKPLMAPVLTRLCVLAVCRLRYAPGCWHVSSFEAGWKLWRCNLAGCFIYAPTQHSCGKFWTYKEANDKQWKFREAQLCSADFHPPVLLLSVSKKSLGGILSATFWICRRAVTVMNAIHSFLLFQRFSRSRQFSLIDNALTWNSPTSDQRWTECEVHLLESCT